MRKLVLLLSLLGLASPLSAQHVLLGTGSCPVGDDPCYEPSTGAESEAIAQAWLRDVHNAVVCSVVNLPEDCTQTQFNDAGGIPGCTPVTDHECTIYNSNGGGLKLFFLARIKISLQNDLTAYMKAYKSIAKTAWDAEDAAGRAAACAELEGCTQP